MDEAMSTVRHAMLALIGVLLFASAGARQLQDPTRPPPGAVAGEVGVVATPSLPSAPQLQAILIGDHQDGRRLAVIDGQTVRLGGKFHDATLVKLSETEAVLLTGKQRQILRLFPASSSTKPVK